MKRLRKALKALRIRYYQKAVHVHQWELPWPNYRRCKKCAHHEWYWYCRKAWHPPDRDFAPSEINTVFADGLSPRHFSPALTWLRAGRPPEALELYLKNERWRFSQLEKRMPDWKLT